MPASVPSARRFTREVLARAGITDGVVDDALLLVSELATSAVLHSHSGFHVRVVAGPVIRVEVADHLPSLPAAPDRSGEPKLTIYLLDAIADRWGWDPTDEGKVVWCELEVPGSDR